MKLRTLSIIFLLLASQIQAQTNEKVLTVFILNFAKYTQWPEAATTGDFVFGVIGSTTVADELKIISGTKTIGTQKIKVKDIQSPKDSFGCHLLFVAESKTSLVSDLASQLSGQPTLIVTEHAGLAKNSGGISFTQVDGKLRFEINKTAIEKKGLKIATALLTLGTVVGD